MFRFVAAEFPTAKRLFEGSKEQFGLPRINPSRGSKPPPGHQPTHPLSVIGASSVAANDTAIELGHGYLPTPLEPVSVEG
jgi:alkanesulfonate monooxygenase SsuD/methylene tetrahydromethanopterin reductase-like flavin-dependent oxidoreductase (luciferase family)